MAVSTAQKDERISVFGDFTIQLPEGITYWIAQQEGDLPEKGEKPDLIIGAPRPMAGGADFTKSAVKAVIRNFAAGLFIKEFGFDVQQLTVLDNKSVLVFCTHISDDNAYIHFVVATQSGLYQGRFHAPGNGDRKRAEYTKKILASICVIGEEELSQGAAAFAGEETETSGVFGKNAGVTETSGVSGKNAGVTETSGVSRKTADITDMNGGPGQTVVSDEIENGRGDGFDGGATQSGADAVEMPDKAKAGRQTAAAEASNGAGASSPATAEVSEESKAVRETAAAEASNGAGASNPATAEVSEESEAGREASAAEASGRAETSSPSAAEASGRAEASSQATAEVSDESKAGRETAAAEASNGAGASSPSAAEESEEVKASGEAAAAETPVSDRSSAADKKTNDDEKSTANLAGEAKVDSLAVTDVSNETNGREPAAAEASGRAETSNPSAAEVSEEVKASGEAAAAETPVSDRSSAADKKTNDDKKSTAAPGRSPAHTITPEQERIIQLELARKAKLQKMKERFVGNDYVESEIDHFIAQSERTAESALDEFHGFLAQVQDYAANAQFTGPDDPDYLKMLADIQGEENYLGDALMDQMREMDSTGSNAMKRNVSEACVLRIIRHMDYLAKKASELAVRLNQEVRYAYEMPEDICALIEKWRGIRGSLPSFIAESDRKKEQRISSALKEKIEMSRGAAFDAQQNIDVLHEDIEAAEQEVENAEEALAVFKEGVEARKEAAQKEKEEALQQNEEKIRQVQGALEDVKKEKETLEEELDHTFALNMSRKKTLSGQIEEKQKSIEELQGRINALRQEGSGITAACEARISGIDDEGKKIADRLSSLRAQTESMKNELSESQAALKKMHEDVLKDEEELDHLHENYLLGRYDKDENIAAENTEDENSEQIPTAE
jgi:hypothetical protein